MPQSRERKPRRPESFSGMRKRATRTGKSMSRWAKRTPGMERAQASAHTLGATEVYSDHYRHRKKRTPTKGKSFR